MSKLSEAIEIFNKLDKQEADFIISKLLEDEKINIPQLVNCYAEFLADFRHKAMNDIRKLADAGLTLGEKEIRKTKTIKSDRVRKLNTALANTLLTAGFRSTKFNEELSKSIDMSIVDKNWYKEAWQLETINQPKQDNK